MTPYALIRNCVHRQRQCSAIQYLQSPAFFQHISGRTPKILALAPPLRRLSVKPLKSRQPSRDLNFVDRLRIQAKGGQGGNGSVSLWRSSAKGKFTPADGGNGGNGGNVVLRATSKAKSLAHLTRSLNGGRGTAGGPQKRHGAVGKDLVIDVPLGTVVYNNFPPAYVSSATAASSRSVRHGSDPAANAAAAVHLAEHMASCKPQHALQERSAVLPLPSDCLSSKLSSSISVKAQDHADCGHQKANESEAGDSLSFVSPDLSFSAWSVVSSAADPPGDHDTDVSQRNSPRKDGNGIHDASRSSTSSSSSNHGSNRRHIGGPFASSAMMVAADVIDDTTMPHYNRNPASTSAEHFGLLVPSKTHGEHEHRHNKRTGSWHAFDSSYGSESSFESPSISQFAAGTSASSVVHNMHVTAAPVATSAQAPPAAKPGSRAQLDALPVVADLVSEGQKVIVARGGRGGRGNATYRTGQNRPASRRHEAGEPGEATCLVLEMKLLADVGLVGFPNAGKSTLLRGISRATPTVASYPFTTLTPQLGVVQFSDGESFTVADIPGLIEGAHANRGLGHAFLRHIQRTRALVFVVDLGGFSFRGALPMSPVRQLDLLQQELRQYDPALMSIPAVVAANKSDSLTPEAVDAELELLRAKTELPVFATSGKLQQGLSTLCNVLLSLVSDA